MERGPYWTFKPSGLMWRNQAVRPSRIKILITFKFIFKYFSSWVIGGNVSKMVSIGEKAQNLGLAPGWVNYYISAPYLGCLTVLNFKISIIVRYHQNRFLIFVLKLRILILGRILTYENTFTVLGRFAQDCAIISSPFWELSRSAPLTKPRYSSTKSPNFATAEIIR